PRVYPVAARVLPVQSSAGANPFALGGGLGGQGGFGGGLGQGGGGNGLFGGGGGGGGGGANNNGGNGGFFAVEEKLSLGGKKEAVAKPAPAADEPKVQRPAAAVEATCPRIHRTVSAGQSLGDAWDGYFRAH